MLGQVSGLPGCVMSFALRRKVPRFKTKQEKLPNVAISTGEKVLELEITHPEGAFENCDFYYESEKESVQV